MPEHTVAQGECIVSIADHFGFLWETLWDHPKNAALRKKRKHPTVLLPGDVVHLPEESKDDSGSSEQKHRFKTKQPQARLRVRLLSAGKPLEPTDYRLKIGGQTLTGRTDDDGWLADAAGSRDLKIPAQALGGILMLGEDLGEYRLLVGSLDPIDETSGLKARLHNLGFSPGSVDGQLDKPAVKAMQAFQKRQKKDGLERTTRPDDDTRTVLEREFGC